MQIFHKCWIGDLVIGLTCILLELIVYDIFLQSIETAAEKTTI